MPNVTLKDIQAKYNDANKVEQIGSKQLFIVTYNNYSLAISYRTIVAIKPADKFRWLITTEKYSITTLKHCNDLAGGRISQDELQALVNKYHTNRQP